MNFIFKALSLLLLIILIGGSQPQKPPSPLSRSVDAIVNACEKYDVPIVWGLPMIYTESSFIPNQITKEKKIKENSRGLGQMLLSTARCYDKKITKEDLLVPEINADLCIRHLSVLLDENNGNMEFALREYNGGNGWRKKSRAYYLRVKKNKNLIFKQEALNEKVFFHNYYYAVCYNLRYGRSVEQ